MMKSLNDFVECKAHTRQKRILICHLQMSEKHVFISVLSIQNGFDISRGRMSSVYMSQLNVIERLKYFFCIPADSIGNSLKKHMTHVGMSCV